MSRFSNLEFGEGESEWSSGQEVVKDEAFYLREGDSHFAGRRFEEALRSYSKVLEFNPENAVAWTAQVRMLIELEEFREAKLWAEKALEKFPVEPDLLAAKAVALARMADLDGAIAFSDASVEERGNSPYVWLARGDVLLARGEKRAEYCFEKAVSLEPGNWLVPWLAARVHTFYGQFSLALKYANRALALAADRAAVWVEVACCQSALGLSALAVDSFERARELDPLCGELEAEIQCALELGFVTRFWRRCRRCFS